MSRGIRTPFLRAYQAGTLLGLFRGLQETRGETFTVLFPRQAGKNEVSAALVTMLLLANSRSGGSVVVCAPTFVPQGRISLERTWRALSAVAPLAKVVPARHENAISVGRASAVFLSASPEAHSAGHTASLALIGDEAQDIDSDWFDRQFRPMAASTGASTVLFGTPWNGETLLDRAVARNREREHVRQMHFEVHWESVAEALPAYGEYVRSERQRLGAGHPLFRTQYELEVAATAGRLFTAAQLSGLAGTHARLAGPAAGDRHVAGLDVAGERDGRDASVMTIARVTGDGGMEVVELASWEGATFEQLQNDALALALRWKLERLTIDATAIGAPVASHLKGKLGGVVEAFSFTVGSKARLGYELIAAAETGRLRIFTDDATAESMRLWQELRACSATPSSAGRLTWGNERGHDDFVASLALCLHAAQGVGSPRVARGRARPGV